MARVSGAREGPDLVALGGFVLDLTPCLPVIPIQVMARMPHAGSPGRSFGLGLWMAAGVVTFWAGIGLPVALLASVTDPSRVSGIWWVTAGIGALIAATALGVTTAVLGLPCFGFVEGALLAGAALTYTLRATDTARAQWELRQSALTAADGGGSSHGIWGGQAPSRPGWPSRSRIARDELESHVTSLGHRPPVPRLGTHDEIVTLTGNAHGSSSFQIHDRRLGPGHARPEAGLPGLVLDECDPADEQDWSAVRTPIQGQRVQRPIRRGVKDLRHIQVEQVRTPSESRSGLGKRGEGDHSEQGKTGEHNCKLHGGSLRSS